VGEYINNIKVHFSELKDLFLFFFFNNFANSLPKMIFKLIPLYFTKKCVVKHYTYNLVLYLIIVSLTYNHVENK